MHRSLRLGTVACLFVTESIPIASVHPPTNMATAPKMRRTSQDGILLFPRQATTTHALSLGPSFAHGSSSSTGQLCVGLGLATNDSWDMHFDTVGDLSSGKNAFENLQDSSKAARS